MNPMIVRPAFVFGVGITLLAACSEATAPIGGEDTQPGILQLTSYGGGAKTEPRDTAVTWTHPAEPQDVVPMRVIVSPDSVSAGVPFEVTTYTIGDGGCWSAEKQEVEISGREVTFRPYDVHSGGEVCTMILAFLPHRSTVTLNEPGRWVLRVTGRRARHGDRSWESPISAEKPILVK